MASFYANGSEQRVGEPAFNKSGMVGLGKST